MDSGDLTLRFLFEDDPVRGQLVSLDSSWREIQQRCDAGPYARNLLGQALAAITLLASTLKFDGNITLQIQGSGALSLLVAQATSEHTLRGIIKQQAKVDPDNDLAALFQADKMVISIDNGKGQPYQGIVPLTGHTLTEALDAYFEQSEQLPTHLWLACDEQRATGMLIQRLPPEIYGELHDADAWNRAEHLAGSVTSRELLGLHPGQLIQRLFHQETLRVFEAQPLAFRCRCSRDRSRNMLQALGQAELEDILREQGVVQVNCDFCNARYDFDAVDITQLFHDKPSVDIGNDTGRTRH